jgi:PPM family protein phosphatase
LDYPIFKFRIPSNQLAGERMKYTHVSMSKTGLRRFENEDSYGVFELDDGLLTILCDGLGGNKAGEVASSLTVETIYNSFIRSDSQDYLERIKNAILAANKMIMEESSSTPAFKGMATTVEVLFLNSNTAYWGHIGDSRIYNLRNNKIKQLTKDHSLVQRLVDEGYLTLKEAENHPNRNIIMKALGDNTEVEADLSKLKLNSKDTLRFFICSDGVTCVVNDEELEEIIGHEDVNFTAEKLSRLIEDRGAPDNYSFVLITRND